MELSSAGRDGACGLGRADGGGLPGHQSLPRLHQDETVQSTNSSTLGGVVGGVQGHGHAVRGVLIGEQFLHTPVRGHGGHMEASGGDQGHVRGRAERRGLQGLRQQLSVQDEADHLTENHTG